MKPSFFRKLVKWALILLLTHFAAMIFFAVILARIATELAIDFPTRAAIFCTVFSLLAHAVFAFYFSSTRLNSSHAVRQSLFVYREHKHPFLSYLKDSLPELCWMAGIVLAFQLPFTVFYALFGFSFTATTELEKLYIMDAGFYLLTKNAFWGLLLNLLAFSVLTLLAHLILWHHVKNDETRQSADIE
ncbi:MAG: hypothetical protein IJW71_04430 [Clostridia bacterium]|nr:hypothetical protein [Clostridia bacterium]